MIVALRSPSTSNTYRSPILGGECRIIDPAADQDDATDFQLDGNLRLLPVHTHQLQAEFAPSWFALHHRTFCFMTGLASDIEQLTRHIQSHVEQESTLFGRPTPTHAIVLQLATHLTAATLSDSRPYGVQIMVVGNTNDNEEMGTKEGHEEDDSPAVYSLDPSGGWHSWNSGITAIGKYAPSLRKQLFAQEQAKWSNNDEPESSLQDVLREIIQTWKAVCRDEGVNVGTADDFQVFVTTPPGRSLSLCRLYQVHDDDIANLFESSESVLSSSSS